MEKQKVSKFADILSTLRKERGISQKKAAADLGISQALLSHYEKGIRECGLDFVIKCSEYYGVTTDYILGVSESRNGLRDDYFVELDTTGENDKATILGKATKYLLDLIGTVATDAEKETIYNYFLLTVYRGAVTLAKTGVLPKEMFNLDYTYARELASAALAVQDAKLVFLEDKSRSGMDNEDSQVLQDLIKEAETKILQNFIID